MIDHLKILAGDRRSLAKAITLIESSKSTDIIEAQKILNLLLPHSGKSFRLGISGSPGVGKSTFIETLGLLLIENGYKVAVLAIDPSSPVNGGSILGDKTRMEKLSNHPNAYVRPSPTNGNLGGVALKTREATFLCEAAGYDFIIIETVGVGQSETEVYNMVDLFMLMILPSGGDELQGIKKGIVEMADAILINKADGENFNLANQTKAQYESALHIVRSSQNSCEVITHSSLDKNNFSNIINKINSYKKSTEENMQFIQRRKNQLEVWFASSLNEAIKNKINNNEYITKIINKASREFCEKKESPFNSIESILKELFKI